jgi:hypothetical protein
LHRESTSNRVPPAENDRVRCMLGSAEASLAFRKQTLG